MKLEKNRTRSALVSILVACSLAGLVSISCGTKVSGEVEPNYYPLAVGNYWDYRETNSTGSFDFHSEVVAVETIGFDHGVGSREVFVVENTYDDTPLKKNVYYNGMDGDRIVRYRTVRYDETGQFDRQYDYVPGFLRFDRSRVNEGDAWEEEFDRHCTGNCGVGIDEEVVHFRVEYWVANPHATLNVPAGTFDCVVVSRKIIEGGGFENKLYYYALGVGEVKESADDGVPTEELTGYNVQ